MSQTTSIEITTDESLACLTHSSCEYDATDLREQIEELEAAGFRVLYARSRRFSVPNSYGPTYKVRAPYYVYEDGEITMVDAVLESRSNGANIPAQYTIAGTVVPDGFRCFKRDINRNELLIRSA